MLQGTEALAWLADQGWSAEPLSKDVRVYADIIWSPTFTLGRLWNSPMRLTVNPGACAPGLTFMTFILTGTVHLQSRILSRVLAPGDFYVHGPADPVTISSEKSHARLFFGVPSARFAGTRWEALISTAVSTAEGAYWPILQAGVMASLNERPSSEGREESYKSWKKGIEHLIFAASSTPLLPISPSQARHPMFERAAQLISANARDPDFSTTELALALNCSKSQLHRIFEHTGAAAGTRLRQTRLQIALDLLDGTASSASDIRRVAPLSGFRSARALRRLINGPGSKESLPMTSLATETVESKSKEDFEITA
ncbi:hypothetical protein C5B85_00040 [Pseudoclavibacter sp. AY1F1]|nr:hypothetical protein C5B85_00040 [Pseudoclavibacter sp. AY1F1]